MTVCTQCVAPRVSTVHDTTRLGPPLSVPTCDRGNDERQGFGFRVWGKERV